MKNVITSVELENMFYNHSIKMANGNPPNVSGSSIAWVPVTKRYATTIAPNSVVSPG